MLFTVGCALHAFVDPVRDPAAVPGACPVLPRAGHGSFHSARSGLIASFGKPRR